MAARVTAKAGACLLMLVMALGCLAVEQVSPPPTPPPPPPPPGFILPPDGSSERTSISAALHLHGWSNHGASTEPASITWHTQQHAAAGVDLLWWTDHFDIYGGRFPDFLVTPTTPVAVTPGLWTVGTWGPGADGSAFLRSRAMPSVISASGEVTVLLSGGDSTQADTIELFFGKLIGSVARREAFGILSRPLVGQPRFTMTVWPVGGVGRFPETQVLVPLAWHPGSAGGSREVLQYTFTEGSDRSPWPRGDTLDIHRAWSGNDSAVVMLQPALDATAFPDGLDNTTDEYRIRFVVPRSDPGGTLSFTLPTVVNAASTAATQMVPAMQLAHFAAQSYGVRAMWGLEVGPQPGPIADTKWYGAGGAGAHLTIYLPEDLPVSVTTSLTGPATAYGALAQSLGGLTSIPHPFGTSVARPIETDSEQSDEARQLGAFLVPNAAWGASLIEVGYVARGGVGLRAHLQLLDYLTASGLHLCGIGVSDSHGGPLLADPTPGRADQYNFVTWIGDVDRAASGAQLIVAMRSCDLSFGNPFYTRGGMWISVATNSVGHQTLSLDTRGVSPSADLFLYEAEVDSTGVGHDPVYRTYGRAVTRSGHPEVGGCRRGFARLEAWAGTRPLAFSNVVSLAPEPDKCSAPAQGR